MPWNLSWSFGSSPPSPRAWHRAPGTGGVAQTGTAARARGGQGATWAPRQGAEVAKGCPGAGFARRELVQWQHQGELSESFFCLWNKMISS